MRPHHGCEEIQPGRWKGWNQTTIKWAINAPPKERKGTHKRTPSMELSNNWKSNTLDQLEVFGFGWQVKSRRLIVTKGNNEYNRIEEFPLNKKISNSFSTDAERKEILWCGRNIRKLGGRSKQGKSFKTNALLRQEQQTLYPNKERKHSDADETSKS